MGPVSGPRPALRGALVHGPADRVEGDPLVRRYCPVGHVRRLGWTHCRHPLSYGGTLCIFTYSQVLNLHNSQGWIIG